MGEMRILLLMCHWLGDTFWSIQVIPKIRDLFPNAEFWVGVKPANKDLVYTLIDKNKVITLKNVISDRHRESFSLSDYLKEIKNIRARKFDIAIDFTLNRYSAVFLILAGIKKRIGLDTHRFSFLYNRKGPSFDSNRHLSERPWEILKIINPKIKKLQWFTPPKTPITQYQLKEKIPINLTEKIALLSPGAGWEKKRWPLENFAKCGNFLMDNGYKLIISGSTKERKSCEELNSMLNNNGIIFIEELKYLIALIPHITLAITNDSGPSHLLAAFGVNTVVLFLATDRSKCAPIGENVVVIGKCEASPDKVIDTIKLLYTPPKNAINSIKFSDN